MFFKYLDCLWAQVQKLKKDRWQERHIPRPYLAFDNVLCEALQHNLPPFTPPPHTEDSIYPMPRVIFRMFDYTDDPEVSVMSKCAFSFILRKKSFESPPPKKPVFQAVSKQGRRDTNWTNQHGVQIVMGASNFYLSSA